MDRQPLKAASKPLTVEYMRWSGGVGHRDRDAGEYNAVEIMDWVAANGGRAYCQTYDKPYLYIVTPEGEKQANPGDIVIRGRANDFYPVPPEAFDQQFEY